MFPRHLVRSRLQLTFYFFCCNKLLLFGKCQKVFNKTDLQMSGLQGITWCSAVTSVHFAHDRSSPYCMMTDINIFLLIINIPSIL